MMPTGWRFDFFLDLTELDPTFFMKLEDPRKEEDSSGQIGWKKSQTWMQGIVKGGFPY